MAEESVRYIERVVTVTHYEPAPTQLGKVAEEIVDRAAKRGLLGTLQTIVIALLVISVVVIAALIGYAFFKVFIQVSDRVKTKIESQDRFKISSKGVEMKVKGRTAEDTDVLAQK